MHTILYSLVTIICCTIINHNSHFTIKIWNREAIQAQSYGGGGGGGGGLHTWQYLKNGKELRFEI